MDREPASSKTFERCPECEYKLPTHANDCSFKQKLGRRSFLRALAASGALAGAGALGFGIGHATPSANNTVIEPGSMADAYDYIMYFDGANWFGKNTTTGQNDPSIKNSDFYTALVAAQALGGLCFYVKPPNPWTTIPLTTPIPLKSGMVLRGNMPVLTNVEPIAPENITFVGGTVFSGSGIDGINGNAVRGAVVEDIGLSGFNNGFIHGAHNVFGISNSCFRRIFFSNVLTPLTITNFQMLRLDQLYAWLPTTYFLKVVNDNANWFGGNSYWTDLFAHGCKNVNGAVQLIAIQGFLSFIESRRLQVNMQDSSFNNSTSGYGLYLQGQSTTAQCINNTFHSLDLEGTPLKAVRLEDYAFTNWINIAFDNLSAGGFDFSLKKNLTAQAPVWNQLFIQKAGAIAVESDNSQNLLFTSGNLTPVTGAFPAGINGFGGASFAGAQFPTLYSGQTFVGATTGGVFSAQTGPKTLATFQVPVAQDMEIGAEIAVSAYTSGTIQVQVTFTDRYNNARTIIIPVNTSTGALATGITATGYYSTPSIMISSIANTTVTVAIIGTFTATYSASAFLRATN